MLGFPKHAVLVPLILTCNLLVACTAQQPDSSATISNLETSQIINGTVVQDGSLLANHTVFLVNRATSDICTATLLGGNFALTAAHCVDFEEPENMYVFFGAKPTVETERRQVIAVKASPYWELRQKERKNTGDIAVIKFDGGDLPKPFAGAEILQDSMVLRKGVETMVLGYGVTSPDMDEVVGAGVLRMASLPISNPTYSATELLLDQTKTASICRGDSGGPAFVYVPNKKDKKTGRYYLWGVANRGLNDLTDTCQGDVAYTSILMYSVWIQVTLSEL